MKYLIKFNYRVRWLSQYVLKKEGKFMNIIWLVAGLMALSSPLRAGSESSGGTDYHPDVPAWFTSQDSTRRISVCFEISPTFIADPAKGVDAGTIAGALLARHHERKHGARAYYGQR